MTRIAGVHVVRYERLVASPQGVLDEVGNFLGLDGAIPGSSLSAGHGSTYQQTWDELASPLRLGSRARRTIIHRYGRDIEDFGYSMHDLSTYASSFSRYLA